MKSLLTVEDVRIPTTVLVDGEVVPDVYTVDILSSTVTYMFRNEEGDAVFNRDTGDFATETKRGQITLQFPEPA